MATKKKSKRTVLYSRAGKKLYAKRDATGRFEDIQSYQRAHAADLRRTSAAEAAAKPARTAAKKKAVKKKAVKKAAAPKPAARQARRKAPARKK